MSQSLVRIFVYGTLKRGFPNHHLIETPPSGKVTYIGCGQTLESYPMVTGTDADIPFLLPFPGKGSKIKGEVYEVDQDALIHLDDLEEHPTWYKRMACAVMLDSSQELSCEAYFLINSKPELMQLTFYKEYTQELAASYCERKLVSRVSSLKGQVQLGNDNDYNTI
ncbi:putative gamma-glutamylcyclotransferase CG2811 [Exaiptasia diaphana]|uniref:Gamma-glutamylcyclotransferase family protein n=1 Tax=Exaiptasia diaphana TaxID=2652724 RepID=A0A913WUA9_EXADI|nr:putative gamma-glutamylcyclotransferase CG2811 [Exaiptasia diaphana]XP_020894241.1 putative gamma-glutamylcyclotransferase CG2811 [Exaiptasia diaphana]XP_020894242.1 putative gamma-glutamylcyclotransferase CG2811 [Exaiptasia diaphana]